MRSAPIFTFLAAAALAIACPSAGPGAARCRDACEVAERCGMLPSTLGGRPEDDAIRRVEACNERCLASVVTDQIDEAIACLQPAAGHTICEIDSCVTALRCMEEHLPGAAVGVPEVTFRLIDGAAWLALFQPELCSEIPGDFESGGYHDACDAPDDPCPEASRIAATAVYRPPLCVDQDCDDEAEVGTENCDPRLCHLNPSPAFDCSYFGIEQVQFGYLNGHDELHLDPAIHSCAEATVGVDVPNVPNGVYYPLAVYHGSLTERLTVELGLPPEEAGRPYCWLSYPNGQYEPLSVGWLAHAGPNLAVVPSPDAAALVAQLRGEPGLFPFACGCLLGDVGCEAPVNANCHNSIDDDSDGLADEEDPNCD